MYDIKVQTDDLSRVGQHDMVLEVELADYPLVQRIKVEFKIYIESDACILAKLEL